MLKQKTHQCHINTPQGLLNLSEIFLQEDR